VIVTTTNGSDHILLRRQMKAIPKVKSFLNSVARNSNNTKRNYETGITYFYAFLSEKHSLYTPETILKPLTNNEINLYELFEAFIDFLGSTGLSVSSIRFYVAALRSYFAYPKRIFKNISNNNFLKNISAVLRE
jgi:site-specific recombinase XerD